MRLLKLPRPAAARRDSPAAAAAAGAAPGAGVLTPPSRGMRQRELTPLEREFLPPLLEIQESPPSPLKRVLLWTLVSFVLIAIVWASIGTVSIVSTAPGKFIPDGRVKEIQPL